MKQKPNTKLLEKKLQSFGFSVTQRDPGIKPEFPGKFMVVDTMNLEGYSIVGDDMNELIVEAYGFLIGDNT